MAIPMQFCMETNSDWLKAMIQDEGPTDNSSSSPSEEEELILPCPLRSQQAPMLERRLRPPHGQLAIKCPRCESTHTKFCYYNNYSLSQPRYFCKTCRRYWTKGGSLRNVPVGGGCRKNKRQSSSKKSPVLVNTTDQNSSMIDNHQFYHSMSNNLNFMFDSAATDHFGSGFGIGLGIQNPLFGGRQEEEEEMNNNAVEVKLGNRMLSLEWPDQAGCGHDSFGYSNGLGLWAGTLGTGHGSSSAAI